MSAIRYTLSVAWKEIQLLVRDRGALAIYFALPIFLGFMMGSMNVLTNQAQEGDILLEVNLVNQDSGPFGREVAKAIQGIEQLDVEVYDDVTAAEDLVAEGEVAALVVIPADFSAQIETHNPTAVDVIVDPGQQESASIVTGIMKQVVDEVTIWGEVQYGIRNLLEESGVLAGASVAQQQAIQAQTLGVIMTTLNDLRRTPVIEVVSQDLEGVVSEGGGITDFFVLLFPGFTVMFIFFNVTTSASSLLEEREAGTLRRLLAAPLPRGTIIGGKMLAFVLLSCIQTVVLFAIASIFFDMPLGQSPLGLVVLTIAVALASASMGMFVAAIAKSANQAGNMGMILGFVLGAIGGCISLSPDPVFRSEGFMGVLSQITPHAHAMEGYYRLLGENSNLAGILPQVGIVLLFSAVLFGIATWQFKFEV
ncbi:MAG: ABC transporter permease [Anaerolineae bacterium]|jgi:ABC-2 type transport system permease protein